MRDGLGCLASGGVLGRCVVGTVGGLGLPLTVVNRRAHVPHHGDSVCRFRCGLYDDGRVCHGCFFRRTGDGECGTCRGGSIDSFTLRVSCTGNMIVWSSSSLAHGGSDSSVLGRTGCVCVSTHLGGGLS